VCAGRRGKTVVASRSTESLAVIWNVVEYIKIFDIADSHFSTVEFTVAGLVFVAGGALVYRYRKLIPKWWTEGPRVGVGFGLVYLAVAAVILMLVAGKTSERIRLAYAEARGEIRIIEGVVTKFQPMPPGGHSRERFCVRNKCFDYSDWEITSAFNWSRAKDGPIREGLPVRITYIGPSILKLEIATNDR
jgi:hypothetical protein